MSGPISIHAIWQGEAYTRGIQPWSRALGVTEHHLRNLYLQGYRGQALIDRASVSSHKNQQQHDARQFYLYQHRPTTA